MMNVDLTGLGRLSSDARFITQGVGGTADVRSINHAGVLSHATSTNDGTKVDGVVTLRRLTASGVTGRLEASASPDARTPMPSITV